MNVPPTDPAVDQARGASWILRIFLDHSPGEKGGPDIVRRKPIVAPFFIGMKGVKEMALPYLFLDLLKGQRLDHAFSRLGEESVG
mgnify:FL=1